MNEKIRQERTTKLIGALRASQEHLTRAIAALEDANLFTNEQQEECIDTQSTALQITYANIQAMIERLAS